MTTADETALIGEIAHRLTSLCSATCCHITGGKSADEIEHNGRRYGGDKGRCDCREVAREVIAFVVRADALAAAEARAEAAEAKLEAVRAALEWYASPAAWTVSEVEGPNGDYGNRARAALALLDAPKGEGE